MLKVCFATTACLRFVVLLKQELLPRLLFVIAKALLTLPAAHDCRFCWLGGSLAYEMLPKGSQMLQKLVVGIWNYSRTSHRGPLWMILGIMMVWIKSVGVRGRVMRIFGPPLPLDPSSAASHKISAPKHISHGQWHGQFIEEELYAQCTKGIRREHCKE